MLPGIACPMLVAGSLLPSEFVLEYIGSVNGTGVTISSSFDIGAAHPEREIFIVSAARSGSGTISLDAATTTVDGIAVTKATTEGQFTSTGPQYTTLSCAFVSVPTGSGAVTVQAGYNRSVPARIAVYRVVNRPGAGGNQADAGSASSTSTSVAVNGTTIAVDQFWLGVCCSIVGGALTPPSGVTEDVQGAVSINIASFCSRDIQGTSSTPTDTWSGASGFRSAASWSFG